MKFNWEEFVNRNISIMMHENYGVVYGKKNDDQPPLYEISVKSGKLVKVFDDGLLLETIRDNNIVQTWVPFSSIKTVDIF